MDCIKRSMDAGKRKRGRWGTVLVLLAMGHAVPGAQSGLVPEAPWTLEAALERARAVHPDAEMARSRLAQAEARLAQAQAGNLPRVDLRASYVQTTDPMQGFGIILSQGTFDNTIDFNDPGQLDNLSGAVEGRYRLYAGGSRKARIGAAEAARAAGEDQVAAAEAALADAVVKAYFGIRQADKVVESLRSGLRVLEENLRVSKAKEEAGELIRTERLNLEVQVAAMRRELLSGEHRARLARHRLAFLLDLPPRADLALAEADPGIEAIVPPGRLSIENRAELGAARKAVEAAEDQIRAARGGRLPTVDAFANYKANKGYRRDGDGTSWTAGVSVSLPIFDGQATRSQIAEARAGLREAEERLRRLRRSLEVDLEEARLAHELAVEQREVARQQQAQAQEAAELSRKRFAAGTLLSTELIGVESRLVEARTQLAIATARERTALAHLRRVTGLSILP